MSLSAEFANLDRLVTELVGLLHEAEETFWPMFLARGLPDIQARKLSGATYVLGCFTGEGSMSDLVLSDPQADPLTPQDGLGHRNLNSRLHRLRSDVFKSANRIASRELW